MSAENETDQPNSADRRWRRSLVPYLLIAPALIYLAMFFAYPMYQGLILAVYDDDALLPVLEEPNIDAAEAGTLDQGTALAVLDRRGQVIGDDAPATDLLTEQWFRVSGTGADGSATEGWVPETRIRIRDEAGDGTPIGGTVRPVLAQDADPLTSLFSEPSETSDVVGQIEQRAAVSIDEIEVLELWFLISPSEDPAGPEGWAPSRFIQVFEDGETGRVQDGSAGQVTTEFFRKMFDDRFFGPAFRDTLLLMVLIIPAQFVLAMIMALVIHARTRLSSSFLYVYSLPIGMSDLAVGILFFSIFTGNGLLNSVLDGLGIIDEPQAFLTADTRNWIIAAIVIAELWRATSIVMVILVSGLQAIPDETLEAAELFGASYWQRIRHIMLPLLRPSIQVALILRTILALQVFAVVIALSGGDIVTVLANETYRQYFELRNQNVASAYAVFILAISIASAVFYLRSVRTQDQVRPS
ncbi:MAG: sugar ABC transporter permease [Actinomycetota bacterium]